MNKALVYLTQYKQAEHTQETGKEIKVGTLAEAGGRVYFQYEPDYLETGWNLSPFTLPFEAELYEQRDRDFGPLPGIFDDSLPDGWGKLLMDRWFRSQNLPISRITPIDRLLWLGDTTMGALTYKPQVEREEPGHTFLNLQQLADNAEEVYTGTAAAVLPELLRNGGSPGGARPKVLVGYNPETELLISGTRELPRGFEPWLIKFTAGTDMAEDASVEYAYSLLAKAAGLSMMPTKLFKTSDERCFFGTKRFDREEEHRMHIHTFGNMIQANFRIPSVDYADYLKVTTLLTENYQELLSAFRQTVFNVFTHNRDDHVKNFSYMLEIPSGNWKLAPSYDLLYTHGPSGEHTMTVLGEGKHPTMQHLLALAEHAGIKRADAGVCITAVRQAITLWLEFAHTAGVSEAKAQDLQHIFNRYTG